MNIKWVDVREVIRYWNTDANNLTVGQLRAYQWCRYHDKTYDEWKEWKKEIINNKK